MTLSSLFEGSLNHTVNTTVISGSTTTVITSNPAYFYGAAASYNNTDSSNFMTIDVQSGGTSMWKFVQYGNQGAQILGSVRVLCSSGITVITSGRSGTAFANVLWKNV